MNVYVGTNTMKNAYIGEYNGPYEFSYDFRNKTTTQVQNDGWFVYNNTSAYLDTRTWSVDSNGLHVAGYSGVLFKMIDNSYFQYAKKITISTHANLGSYIFAQFIGISYFSGTTYGAYGIGNNIDLRQGFRRVEFNGNSVNQTSGSVTTGEHDISMVFDLVNKTAKLSVSGYADISGTITDAAITSVKNNLNCLGLGFYNNSSYPTNTSSYYNNYYLKIEY